MSAKRTNLLILVLLFIGTYYNYAQEGNIIIEAVVIDEETKETLPFTNVIVEGTSTGTITNEEGKFELAVKEKYAKSNVVFSFMGFDNTSKKLQDFKAVGDTIYLKPSSNSLTETVVVGKNKYRELVRDAIKKTKENYPQQPVYMDAYYRELTQIDNQYTKFTDAANRLYYSAYKDTFNLPLSRKKYLKFDRSGEMRKVPFPEPSDFIADANDQVKVIALRKSDNLQDFKILEQTKKLKAIEASNLQWLENNEIGGGPLRLTGADKVKRREDFLNLKLSAEYDYIFDKKSTYNNLPTYVIEFKPKDSLSVTARYCGKIVLDETSKAIISYSYKPTNTTRNQLNQKFATQLKTPESVEEKIKKRFITRLTELQDYSVEVSFSEFDFRWFLKRIKVVNNYKNTGDFLEAYTAVTESELIVNNIETAEAAKFPEQEVYQSTFMNPIFNYELKYDPSFWKSFNALIPTGLMDKALEDLESENSLEEQFQKK